MTGKRPKGRGYQVTQRGRVASTHRSIAASARPAFSTIVVALTATAWHVPANFVSGNFLFDTRHERYFGRRPFEAVDPEVAAGRGRVAAEEV